jgi:hypothetical protein
MGNGSHMLCGDWLGAACGDWLGAACVLFQIMKAKICSDVAVSCGRLSYVAMGLTAAC